MWKWQVTVGTTEEGVFPQALVRGDEHGGVNVLYCPGYETLSLLCPDTGVVIGYWKDDDAGDGWSVMPHAQLFEWEGQLVFRRRCVRGNQRHIQNVSVDTGKVVWRYRTLGRCTESKVYDTAFTAAGATLSEENKTAIAEALKAAGTEPWAGAQNCCRGTNLLTLRTAANTVLVLTLATNVVKHLDLATYWTPEELDAQHVLAALEDRTRYCVINVTSGATIASLDARDLGEEAFFPFYTLDVATKRVWVANYSGCIACGQLP
jgi:hypothetical protein